MLIILLYIDCLHCNTSSYIKKLQNIQINFRQTADAMWLWGKLKQIHTKPTLKANLGVDLLSTEGIRDISIGPL